MPLDFAGWLRVAACLSVRTPEGQRVCLAALALDPAVFARAEERHLLATAEAASRGDTAPARAYLEALQVARREVEALGQGPAPSSPLQEALPPAPDRTLPGAGAVAVPSWPFSPPNDGETLFSPALAPRAPPAWFAPGADETVVLTASSAPPTALPFPKGTHSP